MDDKLMRPQFRTAEQAKKQTLSDKLNGQRIRRREDTIFIPLPPELWRPINGGCCCANCSSDRNHTNPEAFWDTLALSAKAKDFQEHTYTVHAPEFHGAKPLRGDW